MGSQGRRDRPDLKRSILAFESEPGRLDYLRAWADWFVLRCWDDADAFRAEVPGFLNRSAGIVLAEDQSGSTT